MRERRQDAPAVPEQCGKAGFGPGMFRPRNRVATDKMDVGRQALLERVHHASLDGADIGDDAALIEVRPDLFGDGGHRADGGAQDDEVAPAHRPAHIGEDFIGQMKLHHLVAHAARLVGADKAVCKAVLDNGAGDGRTNQPETDDCYLFKHGITPF